VDEGVKVTMASVKYISISPDVLGGAPVITGTRIPAERISELLLQGYTEDALVKEFKSISAVRLRGAMHELTSLGLQKLDEISHEPHPAHA
jgi:uncharacterized protein (DUF433 family)